MRYHRAYGWIAAVCLLVFCGYTLFYSHGYVHTTRKPDSWFQGCICHAETAAAFVDVKIVGPESLGLGQVGTYTISVIRNSNIGAGFNVAAFFGTLQVSDTSEQRLIDGELTHAVPKLASGSDTISWTFLYQAPNTSTFDTLYATGNSVDMNGDPTGDYWNLSENFIVRVGTPMSVPPLFELPLAFRLWQNYPNPFNPTTTIRFRIADCPIRRIPYGKDSPKESCRTFRRGLRNENQSKISLKVFDVLGIEVATLVDGLLGAGEHSVVFDATGLPSGVYFYRLSAHQTEGGQAGDFLETKKLLLVK